MFPFQKRKKHIDISFYVHYIHLKNIANSKRDCLYIIYFTPLPSVLLFGYLRNQGPLTRLLLIILGDDLCICIGIFALCVL